MVKFERLFEPGYIGKLRMKNRIIRAPMWTGFATRDGSVTQRLLDYHREGAKGGAGLVIVEFAYPDDKGSQSLVCQLGIYDEQCIPGLSTLARVIKDNGAKAGIQICHCGRRRFVKKPPIVVAPSRTPWTVWGETIVPDELTLEQIREIVATFGNAAKIAERSGFDMLEIHGAHGYLITQFLSPITNMRNDIYGGKLSNRMRFPLEVVESIRKNVGQGFPISIRINATEYSSDGITIEESKTLAKELEKAGVSAIHVSAGSLVTTSSMVPMHRPLAFTVPWAEEIKRVVHIPVIAGGSITNPQLAEEILTEGKADFVSLARPLLADPYYPQKALEGRPEDIRPCIRCNEGCVVRGVSIGGAVCCTVNPTAGFEKDFDLRPAAQPKKVAVIGGGPGGMEAARVAALRGHFVTLYEERDRLGGALLEASVPEFKKDLRGLIHYFSTQMSKLGVKLVLRKRATVEVLNGEGFDAVVLAAGSQSLIPDIPGIKKQLVTPATEILKGKQTGQNVIVVGGGLVGCEVALHLAAQRKKVSIIEELGGIALGVDGDIQKFLFEGFSQHGIQIRLGLRLIEVSDDGLIAVDRSWQKHNLTANSVVLAMGFEPRNSLLKELEKSNMKVFPVGDCVEPRMIYDAIHEGFLVSFKL